MFSLVNLNKSERDYKCLMSKLMLIDCPKTGSIDEVGCLGVFLVWRSLKTTS
ncbi:MULTISPECIES: hypothetical protein [unclassified Anabaena]|uniref:hypothetical protein n=1 Tax=unclassified Anabaena TaxID=2619674 RepID=UPI002B1F7ED5|nr:hypothetical protein [Anabaena sp. UHCC 0399]MEA5565607.1 hypothetical protein [Anabaena sp. UHCC 0399]